MTTPTRCVAVLALSCSACGSLFLERPSTAPSPPHCDASMALPYLDGMTAIDAATLGIVVAQDGARGKATRVGAGVALGVVAIAATISAVTGAADVHRCRRLRDDYDRAHGAPEPAPERVEDSTRTEDEPVW